MTDEEKLKLHTLSLYLLSVTHICSYCYDSLFILCTQIVLFEIWIINTYRYFLIKIKYPQSLTVGFALAHAATKQQKKIINK